MTDLRDQLADFETLARRLLAPGRGRLVLVHETPARCHPAREIYARTLCRGCYDHHRDAGTLDNYPRSKRPMADFADDYALLRAEGHTRQQIAQRLGMRRNTVDAAYRRSVRAGALTPDRRTA
jgi:hypothetical protein